MADKDSAAPASAADNAAAVTDTSPRDPPGCPPAEPERSAPAADVDAHPTAAHGEPANAGAEDGSAAAGSGVNPLSKNQQKKARRREYVAAKKAERKAQEKAKKKADAAARREAVAAQLAAMTPEEAKAHREALTTQKKAKCTGRKQAAADRKKKLQGALATGTKIVVDLDFEDKMKFDEIRSLCQQLSYCQSVNSHAEVPCHLVFTSLKGTIRERLAQQLPGFTNWVMTQTEAHFLEHFSDVKEKLVYLTADATEEVDDVDPEQIYIIGGVVDRNRYKNMCLDIAKTAGIKAARLPIGEHLKMAGSKVLTVNQVLELLLKQSETKDWKKTLASVIPVRKQADCSAAVANTGAAENVNENLAAGEQDAGGEAKTCEKQPEDGAEAQSPPAKRAKTEAAAGL